MIVTASSTAGIRASIALLVGLLTGATAAQAPTARHGYTISTWYTGLMDSPTVIAADAAGRVYCSTYSGRVLVLEDLDHDGIAETTTIFFDGVGIVAPPLTGLTLHDGKVYISQRGKITVLEDTNGDLVADLVTDIITGLPSGLNHQNNGIVFDEFGTLYVGQGSTTDHGPETDPLAGTILRADDDGSNLAVHATGLRNCYGLAYKAGFGLVAADNGPNADPLVPLPNDEINVIQPGGNYGFPGIYGFPPPGSTTLGPAIALPAHSAPCSLVFDENRVFSGYENDLLVPLIAAGAHVVLKASLFEKSPGVHDGFYDVVANGFLNAISCTIMPDGSFLVADFGTALIYRIATEDSARLRVRYAPRVGELLEVAISAPEYPFHYYWFMLSTGEGTGYTLLNGKTLWLDVSSPVFYYSVTPGNVLNWFPLPGQLDAQGRDTGWVRVPDLPWIVGQRFYMAFVTHDINLNIGSVSEPLLCRVLAD